MLSRIFTALSATVCIPLIGANLVLSTPVTFYDYTPSACVESADELANPYIGLYDTYAYLLSDSPSHDLTAILEQEYGPGLVMLQFNLQGYSESSVSDIALGQLNDILAAWQSAGRQLIVRFLYDWDGDALSSEPESIALILNHMTQVSEIINRYADCVYILQGIFAGAWGEMHGSEYTDGQNMLTLINHLAEVTDPRIFLAVRTPDQWRAAASDNPLFAREAPDVSLPARLGLFNDGLLASDTDLGTYASSDDPENPSGKQSREREILFQNLLCTWVPNGGETVTDNPYNDFPAAVADLSAMRISYLNRAYDAAVLSKWADSVYTGDDLFRGMNGFDYITRHLGYRYVLRSSDFAFSDSEGSAGDLSVVLENVGFSNCYRSFDVFLILRDVSSLKEYVIPVSTDTRLWNPGEEICLKISLDFSNYASGAHEAYLKISDVVSGFDILMANESEQSGPGCFLGLLSLGQFSKKDFLLSASVGEADEPPVGLSSQH